MTTTLPEQFITIPGTVGGIIDVGSYGGIGQLDTFQDYGLPFYPGITEQYLFSFSVPAGMPTVINAWIAYPSGQGTPTLLNYAGTTVAMATNDGDDDRLIYTTSGSSNQFTLVVDDSPLNAGDNFSVVIAAVPEAYVNNQSPTGTTEATATQLDLSQPQEVTGQLGLIYQRAAIVTNGMLDYLVGSAVDQASPGTNPDMLNNPTASYHFSVSATGTMTFANKSNAVVVLHEEPSGPIAVGDFRARPRAARAPSRPATSSTRG
jgi:hypothetical protein